MAKKKNKTIQEFTRDQVWANRISRREKHLEQLAERRNWQRFIDEFNGDYSKLLGVHSSIIPINLVNAYVRTEIPSLYLQDPHFEFTPKQKTTIESAKLKEIAVNDLWHRKKFKKEVKKGIQDAKIVGHGWYKVGYQGDVKAIETQLENKEFIGEVQDDYFFYRINWRHIIFSDESIDPPYDCNWIAQRFYVPLDDAKTNKDFDAKKRSLLNGVTLSGDSPKEEDKRKHKFDNTESDILYAELYEVWDKVEKKVLIISKTGSIGVLQERKWPYKKMSGFPFLFLPLSFVNDEPYPYSDVGMGEPTVLEKIKIRNAFLNHLKRGNRQIVTKKDNLEKQYMDAYERGDDSALLEATDPFAFSALPYAPFQPDVFGLESRLDDDLAQQWGQSPNARSGSARTQTRTKFELERQTFGTVERRSEEINVIQDVIEEAAEKISSLLEQYATQPYYVSLTGFSVEDVAKAIAGRPSADGPNAISTAQGFTVTRDDIKGPIDVRIKRGSAIPLDKQSKIELLKELAALFVQFKQAVQNQPSPFMLSLARNIVEEAGMPELDAALDEETQLLLAQQKQQEQLVQKTAEERDQQQQLIIGQEATKTQLQAEELAIKRQKVESDTMVDLLNTVKEIQSQVSQLRSQQIDKTND